MGTPKAPDLTQKARYLLILIFLGFFLFQFWQSFVKVRAHDVLTLYKSKKSSSLPVPGASICIENEFEEGEKHPTTFNELEKFRRTVSEVFPLVYIGRSPK